MQIIVLWFALKWWKVELFLSGIVKKVMWELILSVVMIFNKMVKMI